MTREAIEYFKFQRKIFCEEHLKICPKDSIAYQATLKEKEFYDMAIKALEQETVSKESYDHEYFLRKELEIKIAKLEQQEPFINKPCVSSGVCEHDKQKVLDKIRAEIKEWYWQIDKQRLTEDPCVIDAMIDLFIRTIDKYKAETEGENDTDGT